jgi:hypothetical protein
MYSKRTCVHVNCHKVNDFLKTREGVVYFRSTQVTPLSSLEDEEDARQDAWEQELIFERKGGPLQDVRGLYSLLLDRARTIKQQESRLRRRHLSTRLRVD